MCILNDVLLARLFDTCSMARLSLNQSLIADSHCCGACDFNTVNHVTELHDHESAGGPDGDWAHGGAAMLAHVDARAEAPPGCCGREQQVCAYLLQLPVCIAVHMVSKRHRHQKLCLCFLSFFFFSPSPSTIAGDPLLRLSNESRYRST